MQKLNAVRPTRKRSTFLENLWIMHKRLGISLGLGTKLIGEEKGELPKS